MINNYCIELDKISKQFLLPSLHKKEIREYFIQFRKLKSSCAKNRLIALKDINLKVKQGEFVSIIGRNGSGKSTLLKILAGVYLPTTGIVNVRGDVSSFLELGVGFNSELTALENIYLYSAILGFSKSETRKRVDNILKFAELVAFRNALLHTFSNGMVVRLAFSVAIQSLAPIFLLDEVLAVGDEDFKMKCYEEFEKMKKNGRTIIYASHDMESVLKFSDRVMYLNKGETVKLGEPDEVVKLYLNESVGKCEVARKENIKKFVSYE